MRELTKCNGEDNKAGTGLRNVLWPLLLTLRVYQLSLNIRVPKLGQCGEMDPTKWEREESKQLLCQRNAGRRRAKAPDYPGSMDFGGEGQKEPLSRDSPHSAYNSGHKQAPKQDLIFTGLAVASPDPALPLATAGPASPTGCWPPPAFVCIL